MTGTLTIRNRQRAARVDIRLLRRMTRLLLQEELGREEFELGVYLVGEPAMTRLNETHLHHRGSTDVITFDYNDPARPQWLGGEIFICVPEAIIQARRFHTTWQSEVVRYAVHGILHLLGYADHTPHSRKQMKREEDRLVRRLASRFNLARVGGTARSRSSTRRA